MKKIIHGSQTLASEGTIPLFKSMKKKKAIAKHGVPFPNPTHNPTGARVWLGLATQNPS